VNLNRKRATPRSIGRANDSLALAEWFLCSLALLLADDVAGVACRARIDCRGPVGRVLGEVGRDVEVAQIIAEPIYIVSLVGAERQAPRSGRITCHHSRSRVPVAEPSSASTARPCRFSVSALPM
jgi:hypothetical protein